MRFLFSFSWGEFSNRRAWPSAVVICWGGLEPPPLEVCENRVDVCLSAVVQVEVILPREWVSEFLTSLWAVVVWFPNLCCPVLNKWSWKLSQAVVCQWWSCWWVQGLEENRYTWANAVYWVSPITYTGQIQHFPHVFADSRLVPACLRFIWKWQLQEQEKITSKKPSSSQNASRGSIDIYVCSAVDTFISLVITTFLALPLFLGCSTIYAMGTGVVLYKTAQTQSSPSGWFLSVSATYRDLLSQQLHGCCAWVFMMFSSAMRFSCN